tara:strand:+ start:100 stop:717 length:618 start_codon:yes stop_codon:yes gene_type:complete
MHEVFFQNIIKLLIAIDPIALIPIFATLSTKIPKNKILKLGIVIFTTSTILLTFFAIYGNIFLKMIGISIISFQIAGGVFLFVIAFEMLFEKRSQRKEKLIDKDFNDEYLLSFSIFPISIPLIVGPSAITLSILVSENFVFSFFDIYTKIFPILIVLLFTVCVFFTSKITVFFLGKSAILILQKIFGMILGALAIEFIINGFKLL